MPRRPRVFVEGGIYHVYNRFARGAEIFREGDEAERFVSLLRRARDRDGLTIFAWCLMSNHYHLAIRTGPVPLARTMGFVQARFGQSYNKRWSSTGPLWQSRYKAQLVGDPRYSIQLIAYIHLNPVSAQVVEDPADYPHSGHLELIGKIKQPLVHVDAVLGLFGENLNPARRIYVGALRGAREAEWRGELPGHLPWWQREPDRPLESERPESWVDELGRSTGLERWPLGASDFLEAACVHLDVELLRLAGEARDREVSGLRYLIAALGVERWGISTKAIADRLGRRADVVTRWVRRGTELRADDPDFADRYNDLDKALAKSQAPTARA